MEPEPSLWKSILDFKLPSFWSPNVTSRDLLLSTSFSSFALFWDGMIFNSLAAVRSMRAGDSATMYAVSAGTWSEQLLFSRKHAYPSRIFSRTFGIILL